MKYQLVICALIIGASIVAASWLQRFTLVVNNGAALVLNKSTGEVCAADRCMKFKVPQDKQKD